MPTVGPSSINKLAGVKPNKVLAAGTTSGLKGYAIQLASGTTITACSGIDSAGNAYDFVVQDNWDAATSDFLLVSGDCIITDITTSGGISALYQ